MSTTTATRRKHRTSSSASTSRSLSNNYGSRLNAAIIPRDPGPPLRTLEDVREQVAQEVAVRAVTKAELLDGESIQRYFHL